MAEIIQASSPEQLSSVRELFREYASSLGFDLSFQDFDRELAALPGEYAPPDGRLIMAVDGATAAGCVALRKIADGICEMKRLYVRHGFKSKGIGKALVNQLVAEAKQAGYACMRLDTVPAMKEAIGLYRTMGFHEIAPYRYNPVKGAIFFELDLHALPCGEHKK